MKTFTPTEVRRESPMVYNEVQRTGAVAIAHRDRPLMILITQQELDRRIEEARK